MSISKLNPTDTSLDNFIINKLNTKEDYENLERENGINPNELYLVVNDTNNADTIGGKELSQYDLSYFQNKGEDPFLKKSEVPEVAENANKLGGELPSYYASKTEVDTKINESVAENGAVANAINDALAGYSNAVVTSNLEGANPIDESTLLYIDFDDSEEIPTYITSNYQINNKELGTDGSLVLTGEDIKISSNDGALSITGEITAFKNNVDEFANAVEESFATRATVDSELGASIEELNDKIGGTYSAEQTVNAAIEDNAAAISGINEKIGEGYSNSNTIAAAIETINTTIGAINNKIGDDTLPDSTETLTAAINNISGKLVAVSYYTATVTSEGWQEESDGTAVVGYSKVVIPTPIEGISAGDKPIIDIDLSEVALTDQSEQIEAWNCITRVETGDGRITLYAVEQPQTAFDIQLMVVK